ncbi:hypothetical protein BCR35DRAFT_331058 [Leucosporidium creatinivorum]|uniref:Uncharacterized protein n=1 Tax=Leucosporidium creatinivorum TaxID=106004 RepID=A0A1Y2FL89_9BASI|nr:hypothetical protein BCR35DRAFT_331058 [Leucosporidium creatinivorum]
MDFLSSFPGMSPLTMINLSSINAALKLMQCQAMGFTETSIRDKFHRPWNPTQATDFSTELEFSRFARAMDQVDRMLQQLPNKDDRWTPILYKWEMYPGAARGGLDFGHLVFSNATLQKFILVNIYGAECGHCGRSHEASYKEHLMEVSQRFLNLITYLDLPTPKW